MSNRVLCLEDKENIWAIGGREVCKKKICCIRKEKKAFNLFAVDNILKAYNFVYCFRGTRRLFNLLTVDKICKKCCFA
jgi:hypothetical protein